MKKSTIKPTKSWSVLRSLLALGLFILLSGCMLAHQQPVDEHQDQTAMTHEMGAQASTSAPTAEQPAAEPTQPRHEAMPMMHGGGGWHWVMGGMMVVMMAIVIL